MTNKTDRVLWLECDNARLKAENVELRLWAHNLSNQCTAQRHEIFEAGLRASRYLTRAMDAERELAIRDMPDIDVGPDVGKPDTQLTKEIA